MPYGLIDYDTLKDISNAIRLKTNSNRQYYPRDMARAIDQIKTAGMGFDQPVSLSITPEHIQNKFPTYPRMRDMKRFEQINSWNNSYQGTVMTNVEWTGMSPDKMSLYFRMDGPNIVYGLLVDGNNWATDQSTIIDISNMFSGSYYLTTAYCGKYTSNMHNAYHGCSNLIDAVCGDYVYDLSEAYNGCSNLRTAACGNIVENMSDAYAYCGNLTTAVFGPNVKNIANAYIGCYQLTGEYTIPPTAIDISQVFQGCGNINYINGNVANVENAIRPFPVGVNCDWNNFHWGSLNKGIGLYQGVTDILSVSDFPSLYNGYSMFENCHSLLTIGYFGRLNVAGASASRMFANCYNLTQAAYDAFMANISNETELTETFSGCQNIKNVHISSSINVNKAFYTFRNAEIVNVTFDNDVTYVGSILAASGIENAVCSDHIIDMSYMYQACNNLKLSDVGNNVTTMYYSFHSCPSLIYASCGPNVTNMWSAYESCTNLATAVSGPNVIGMQYAFRFCNNLVTAACGPNVENMFGTYDNCFNLTGDITLEKVNQMARAFFNAHNLQNIAILSNSITANGTRLANAFYRSYYGLRRNIVLTNYNSYENFIITSYNAVGYMIKDNVETYVEPVDVVVDGVTYSAVRCAYNANYNTYIYCTE